MLENVLQNRHYMLVCIQYEVLQGTPIFWAYQNFCKSIGDDVMNYKEFDDWYYHFYNGEFNLDRDRSLDPKKAELKDMPVDVMGNIIENLDFGERAILRKVSHNLCETVDNYKQHFEEISLKFVYEKTVLKFDDREIGYFDKKSESENSENPSENSSENPEDVNVEKEKPWTLALRDLSTVLKNPKLKIDKLSIDFDESLRDAKRLIVEESTQKTLEKNFQIPAKSLHLNVKNQQSVLAVLPYLKPGFLENLHIKHYAFTSMEISAKIGDLEQWKKAKFLEIDRGIKCSVEHFFHFTKMNIDLRQVSNSDVIWLRDTLLTSPTFEECQLGFITIFHRYKPYGTKNIPIPGSSNGGYLSTEYGDQYVIFKKHFN